MSSPTDFDVHGTWDVDSPFGRLHKFFFTYEIIKQQTEQL